MHAPTVGSDVDERLRPHDVRMATGWLLPYRWENNGDELMITTDLLGAVFDGRWSDDGKMFSGGWRPMPGRDGRGNIAWTPRGPSRSTIVNPAQKVGATAS
jgi:hypothetical protein